jgi:molybdate transport system substrate-binding protein
MRRRSSALLLLISMTAATAACGSSASGSDDSGKVSLTVLGAASLSKVLPAIGTRFSGGHPGVTLRFTFAGTDSLVTQIEQGAPADVFAGASEKYGDRLSSEGLVLAPQVFVTNRLVLVVPPSDPAGIASVKDLTKPIKLVIGAESVPVGSYTRTALKNLDALYGDGYSEKVLANVASNEDSVEGVLSKVRLGEADAGLVYVTDAKAAGAAVKTLELPDEAQAVASYPIAVVKESSHRDVAGEFVDFVLGPECLRLLAAAGFGPPPPS